ncbi:MAG: ferrous iron transport protein A [Halothiobacillaceae bacterium]|jgi:ferrous iron transport protein A|nr:MAG: ferrous iron transport protein A [Halothiobacillaceae bacterium]
MKLSCLRCGESASVTCVQGDACLVRRLQALGVRPGKDVSVIRRAAFNGPLHLRVGSTEFFLRSREAESITVQHAV